MKKYSNPIPNNMVPEDTPLQHVPEVMPEQDEIEAIEAYINGPRIACSVDEIKWQ